MAHFHVLFVKSCCVYSSSVKQCLRSVNHEQFPIQMTHNSSTKSGCNSSASKIFSTEIPLKRERRLEIQREQRRRRREQEIAEQREHRLAQRRQRRQQATEEQRNRRLECPRHSGWISLPLVFLRCTFEFILNTAPQGSNSVNGREKQFNAIYFKFQTVQRTHGAVVWGVKTGTTKGGVTSRMCGRVAETLPRVLLGCSALVQSKYLNRNNAALKMLFFEKIEVDRRVSVLTDWRVRVRIPWKQIFRNLIFFSPE